MQRDRRCRFGHGDADAVAADQQAELFLQVMAEKLRPGDRRRIDARRADIAVGQARIDMAEAAGLDADLRIAGAVARDRRSRSAKFGEGIDQECRCCARRAPSAHRPPAAGSSNVCGSKASGVAMERAEREEIRLFMRHYRMPFFTSKRQDLNARRHLAKAVQRGPARMTAVPARASATPVKSQRSGRTPSTIHSQASDAAI